MAPNLEFAELRRPDFPDDICSKKNVELLRACFSANSPSIFPLDILIA
jgi:hypothetical protein